MRTRKRADEDRVLIAHRAPENEEEKLCQDFLLGADCGETQGDNSDPTESSLFDISISRWYTNTSSSSSSSSCPSFLLLVDFPHYSQFAVAFVIID